MALVTHSFSTIRGDTIYSPVWFIINEDLPSSITFSELEQGIADGTYTLMDLSRFEIRGMVRESPISEVFYELNIQRDESNLRYWFIIPPSVTEPLINQQQTFVYDIEFRDEDDVLGVPYVRTHIAGSFTIRTDITHNDIEASRLSAENAQREANIRRMRHYG